MQSTHFHGGLIGTRGSSPVSVAVQAFLHSSKIIMLLEESDHCFSCASASQCVQCSLKKIAMDMRQTGIADPSPLILKWQGVSSRMILEKRVDPLEVLTVFVDIMRIQHLGTDPKFTLDAFNSNPLCAMWKTAVENKVSCSSCGLFKKILFLPLIELGDSVTDMRAAILNNLFKIKEDVMCPRCAKENSKVSPEVVVLPQCLIVHFEKCNERCVYPFTLDLLGKFFSLKSIILQPKEKPCFFIGICPDGRIRKIEDARISYITPAKLVMLDFKKNSKISLIFEERDNKQIPDKAKPLPLEEPSERNKGVRKNKVYVMPDLSSINMSSYASFSTSDTSRSSIANLSLTNLNISSDTEFSHGKTSLQTEDAFTQTCPLVADKAVQTGAFGTFELCKANPRFKLYTGLNVEDFYILFNLIGGHEAISTLKLQYSQSTPKKFRQTKLSSEDKLYLFLIRLRRGLPLEELSDVFGLSVAMIGELLCVMTRLIYLTFKSMEKEMFVSAANQRKYAPKKMRQFKNLRVLLDGASFAIQTPSNFEHQGNTYSAYKSGTVLVFTIGIACNGATIFCSEGMEGCMSDKEVVFKSGLLGRLSSGDGVMTDRGYELTSELQAIGCKFYKPPLLGGRQCFTSEEEIVTKAIASARICTEHAIADIKDNRLLQGIIPMTLLPVIDNLVYIAAFLRNFNSCRIHDRRLVVRNNESESH